MRHCRFCDLPTPDPPVSATGVDGGFCCRGCLEVARRLDDVDDSGTESVETGEATPGGDRGTTENDPTADEAALPSDVAEAYLAVGGMHCTTCETFLGLRGDDCPRVRAVEANYGTETARVVYDREEIERAELPEALRRLAARSRSPPP